MLLQLYSITRATFVEAIRQPIFVVLLLIGTLLMVINPTMSAYSMEPGSGDNKMLVDIGLGTVLLSGIFLSAFTAAGVINQELANKTALTVVSRPVPRTVFILGKYIGVSGAILIAMYLLMLVLMFTLRHRVLQNARDPIDWPVVLFGLGAVITALGVAAAANYLYKKVFTSTFIYTLLITLTAGFAMVTIVNKQWAFQSPVTDFLVDQNRMAQVAVGGVLIAQCVLILTAFAVMLSTRFNTIVTLVLCIGVVAPVGIMAGTMNQVINHALTLDAHASVATSISAIFASDVGFLTKALYLLVKGVYVVAPNFQFHWPGDAILQGNSLTHDAQGNVSLDYIGYIFVYTMLYISAVIALGVAMFQTREVS